jgi:hypothetical protein
MSWRSEDIDFDLLAQLSETPVATLRISTPDGTLIMMGEPERTNLDGPPFPHRGIGRQHTWNGQAAVSGRPRDEKDGLR